MSTLILTVFTCWTLRKHCNPQQHVKAHWTAAREYQRNYKQECDLTFVDRSISIQCRSMFWIMVPLSLINFYVPRLQGSFARLVQVLSLTYRSVCKVQRGKPTYNPLEGNRKSTQYYATRLLRQDCRTNEPKKLCRVYASRHHIGSPRDPRTPTLPPWQRHLLFQVWGGSTNLRKTL